MAPASNFLNYALRVFVVTMALPVACLTAVAAVVGYLATADGSILRGLLGSVCGIGVWGFVGTLAAAQTAIAMGASRIIDHVALNQRIREFLPPSAESQPADDVSLDEFRRTLHQHEKDLVTRPEDSPPASIVGSWLLRRMQKLAVWATERVIRSRFTARREGIVVVVGSRLRDGLASGLEGWVVSYVRRKALLITAALCVGGILASVCLTWAIRLLPF